jgi:hypothetical protein
MTTALCPQDVVYCTGTGSLAQRESISHAAGHKLPKDLKASATHNKSFFNS